MEVRPDILKKLLCSVCGEYLSCSPVRIKNDGAALCGRCCDPEGVSTLRITPYEHLAEMFLFPCPNKTHGCTKTLYMAEMKDHEEECEYRQYVCPVTESGQCDWSGARKNILDHCQEQHPDNLLQNSGTIQHQINETNQKTFLLTAYQMLFIIHCKVCITSKNIFHSVRLIGKSALANNYEYVLIMLNKKKELIMRQGVASQDCMAWQEDISVNVDFNTIQKFLGDLKDTIFKIRIERKCVKCEECVIESAWPTDEGRCCKDCAPATRQCQFLRYGCSYTDTDIKVDKHEIVYCQHGNWCAVRRQHVFGSRSRSHTFANPTEPYRTGVTWRARVENQWKYFIIASDVGKLSCRFILNDSQFILDIWSPLHTEQLSNYRCAVNLTNPKAGHRVRHILPLYYSEKTDWKLILNKDDFLMYVCSSELHMKIELIKK